ncbi:MAG TPA: DinB family protein [Candidatus Acidoferrales bacterium]|nr:DinB family protein [Candidatus Acidoferrales bacterium]
MARMSVPLSAVLQDLQANEERAKKLAEGVSANQANWHPAANSWSIWQCLDHLSRINAAYSEALREAVDRFTGRRTGMETICPGALSAWFIRALEPPVRTKMKAPGKGVPAEKGEPSQALDGFLASRGVIRRVTEAGAGMDLNRIRFRNPFIPLLRFTVGAGLLIINAHDRRHLWQMEQIKKMPGYPSG